MRGVRQTQSRRDEEESKRVTRLKRKKEERGEKMGCVEGVRDRESDR